MFVPVPAVMRSCGEVAGPCGVLAANLTAERGGIRAGFL